MGKPASNSFKPKTPIIRSAIVLGTGTKPKTIQVKHAVGISPNWRPPGNPTGGQ